jgi:hypothetical protein
MLFIRKSKFIKIIGPGSFAQLRLVKRFERNAIRRRARDHLENQFAGIQIAHASPPRYLHIFTFYGDD